MRSFCPLVDILGENISLPVECQREPAQDDYLETAHEDGREQTVKAPGRLTRFGRVELPRRSSGDLSSYATHYVLSPYCRIASYERS
jgi:hypothetical protein